MTTIFVPAPPKSAFNKNRPVSDLLQHQLRHFQHIEATLPAELRSGMTSRDITTENGAARYIAHLTGALRSLKGEPAPAKAKITSIRKRPATAPAPIAVAAAAESAPAAHFGAAKKPAAKQSPSTTAKPHKPRSKRP